MGKIKTKKNIKTTLPIKTPFRGVLATVFVLIVVGAAVIAFVFAFDASYRDVIYPGTFVGHYNLSKMTYAAAEELLTEATNELLDAGFLFTCNNETFVIPTIVGDPANPELVTQLAMFDIDATLKQLQYGQAQQNEAEHIYYWVTGWQSKPYVTINKEALIEALREELGYYEEPAINTKLEVSEAYEITVTEESPGMTFDYDAIVRQVTEKFQLFSHDAIPVALEREYPTITQANSKRAIELAKQVFASAPFVVIYEEYAWELSKEQIRAALQFQIDDGKVVVGLLSENMADYYDMIAQEIDVEVREAKFAMEDGKVVEFQPSQKGRSLQIKESNEQISRKIRQVGITEIDLIVDEVEPEVTTDSVNNLGIQELIGEGHSSFAGSPRNRRHNIAVGASTLNGILIEPGEQFSLVRALGVIEASTGYLPELVIKGNKTIPEYGGGLCQIGTTTFRVALDAGFPITERRNHSYRVSYYEPAGTDAAIYNPKPDFRFINDTEHHVLFTTEIDGNDLYFRFYGTSDGRTVENTKPRIFNYVRPGPTKLLETTDLAPGEKKCTERAHTGANTEFTRTITNADGTQTSEVFSSHYKPWQEVCLIGVEELSE